MKMILRNLWNDEVGAVISTELTLVTTVLGLGLVTGLTSLRDSVVTELMSVGSAINHLDQSYTVGGVQGPSSSTPTMFYTDNISPQQIQQPQRGIEIFGGTPPFNNLIVGGKDAIQ